MAGAAATRPTRLSRRPTSLLAPPCRYNDPAFAASVTAPTFAASGFYNFWYGGRGGVFTAHVLSTFAALTAETALSPSSSPCCSTGLFTLMTPAASAKITSAALRGAHLRSSSAGALRSLSAGRALCPPASTVAYPLSYCSYGCSKATAGMVFWIPKLIWW